MSTVERRFLHLSAPAPTVRHLVSPQSRSAGVIFHRFASQHPPAHMSCSNSAPIVKTRPDHPSTATCRVQMILGPQVHITGAAGHQQRVTDRDWRRLARAVTISGPEIDCPGTKSTRCHHWSVSFCICPHRCLPLGTCCRHEIEVPGQYFTGSPHSNLQHTCLAQTAPPSLKRVPTTHL